MARIPKRIFKNKLWQYNVLNKLATISDLATTILPIFRYDNFLFLISFEKWQFVFSKPIYLFIFLFQKKIAKKID